MAGPKTEGFRDFLSPPPHSNIQMMQKNKNLIVTEPLKTTTADYIQIYFRYICRFEVFMKLISEVIKNRILMKVTQG